jgi:2-amino-4-hydroxy-6-hydroxymethyldihydropteridine diphosphokinase
VIRGIGGRLVEALLPSTRFAFLGLGSNLGDRLALLQQAVDALDADTRTRVEAVSSVYETEPVGGPAQDPFLNIAIRIATRRSPSSLLALCQRVEADLGRVRTVRWGPRTVDVDILLYAEEVVDRPDLAIPHPRLLERAFALVPLVEVAPGQRLPDGSSLSSALARLAPVEGVTMVGSQVRGPGRVGTALGMALAAAGYRVEAVAGRGEEAARRFVERVPTARPHGEPAEAAAGADLVVLAVPDDALAEVVRDLALADAVAEGARVIHVSGGHGTAVLRPLRLAGAAVAACHPAQTFPDPDRGLASLPGTTWAVTAEPADLGWASVLVTDLRGTPVPIAERNRTLYHAGLAVGANATTSVVTLARDLLLGAGVTDPGAFLGPLVTTAAGNAAEQGAAALTGPVRRGDAGTVAAHLEELRAVLPEVVDAYTALARLALAHARRAGLGETAARAVEQVLGVPGAPAADPAEQPPEEAP